MVLMYNGSVWLFPFYCKYSVPNWFCNDFSSSTFFMSLPPMIKWNSILHNITKSLLNMFLLIFFILYPRGTKSNWSKIMFNKLNKKWYKYTSKLKYVTLCGWMCQLKNLNTGWQATIVAHDDFYARLATSGRLSALQRVKWPWVLFSFTT